MSTHEGGSIALLAQARLQVLMTRGVRVTSALLRSESIDLWERHGGGPHWQKFAAAFNEAAATEGLKVRLSVKSS